MSQTNTCFCSDLQIGTETKLPGRFMGKQMYATLIDFGALPTANSQKSVPHGLTDLDQYGIDNGRSFVDQGNGSRHALFYPNTMPNAFWRAKVDESEVAIQAGEDRSSFTAIVCVWYTKMSDVPGVGTEPEQSGDLDWSYAEQWTGRLWANGKKVYQKTVNVGALPNAASAPTSKVVAHNIPNVDIVVSFDGFCHTAAGAFYPIPCAGISNSPINVVADRKNIDCRCFTDRRAFNAYITIFYTCTDR